MNYETLKIEDLDKIENSNSSLSEWIKNPIGIHKQVLSVDGHSVVRLDYKEKEEFKMRMFIL